MLSQQVLVVLALIWCVVCLIRQCTPPAQLREPTPELIFAPRPPLSPIKLHETDQTLQRPLSSKHRKRRTSAENIAQAVTRELAREEFYRMDPSRRKRRRLRKELRGMSVEDLCSGLSPGTLAVVRHSKPRPFAPFAIQPKCRRHSIESAPILSVSHWGDFNGASTSALEPAPEVKVKVEPEEPSPEEQEIEVTEPEPSFLPSPHQKKTSGLRKMVRKLF